MSERAPTILNVDDNDTGRSTLTSALGQAGFVVWEAATAGEALRLARQQPDLVLLDVCLPDGNGLDVCRRLKADPRTALTPVLMVSGFAVGREDRVHGLEDGADGYLTKPLDPGEVIAHARALLRLRRAEEALLLRDRAIRAVSQGIVITDPARPDNPVVYASPGFERMTGYSAAEVLGRNCRFLQGPDTDPAAVARVRRAVAEGRGCEVELLNYRKDGSAFWCDLHVTPVRDGDRLTHFVGVQVDVTERRRQEELARQAQKMEAIGRLAGGVAHDFNNLLTVINGYADLVLGMLPAGEARDMVAEMARSGGKAATLTRQLLAFGRKTVLAPRTIDLNETVREMGAMLRRLLGADIELSVRTGSSVGPVHADPSHLEQVVLNLALNARDAMPGGGRLTIETREVDLEESFAVPRAGADPGRYVLLAVSDTGCGMTEEVRRHAFEPFFTTKPVGRGTGLGLATVYGIVRQGGGHVEVASEPGVGTTFKVYLPRADEDTTPMPAPARFAAMRGTETVLLVEDDVSVRAWCARVLRAGGYEVLEAGDGGEALRVRVGFSGTVHLLVTDLVMPGLGGRPLAERIVALYPGTKVLYLSGYTDDAAVRQEFLRDQANFLQKPFPPAALARKVREVLDAAPAASAK
jgi:PAS domain S-box-containing protein